MFLNLSGFAVTGISDQLSTFIYIHKCKSTITQDVLFVLDMKHFFFELFCQQLSERLLNCGFSEQCFPRDKLKNFNQISFIAANMRVSCRKTA